MSSVIRSNPEYGDLLLELGHLVHLLACASWIVQENSVDHERSGQKKITSIDHSDAGVETDQQARPTEQEQDSATAHGERRRGRAFHFGVAIMPKNPGLSINSSPKPPPTDGDGNRAAIRILVADDFEAWRRQLRSLFQARPQWQIIAEVSDGSEAVQKAADLKPNLIVLDIGSSKLNGIEAARQMRQLSP